MKCNYPWPRSAGLQIVLQMVRNWNAARLPPSLAPATVHMQAVCSPWHRVKYTKYPELSLFVPAFVISGVCSLWGGCVSRRGTARGSAPGAWRRADADPDPSSQGLGARRAVGSSGRRPCSPVCLRYPSRTSAGKTETPSVFDFYNFLPRQPIFLIA